MGNAKDDNDIKAFNGAVVNCVIQQIVGILYSPAAPGALGSLLPQTFHLEQVQDSVPGDHTTPFVPAT
jgi:hypothetical protein